METFSALLIISMAAFSLYPLIFGKRATISLVLANLFVFSAVLYLYFTSRGDFYSVMQDLIFYPSDVLSPRAYTMLTSAFLHFAPLHIFMNLVFLFLLGFPLEIKAGARKVVVVYLISAVGGSMLYAVLSPGNVPALGASGAISGLLGALVALYPRDEIPMFVGPIFLTRTPVYLAAAVFLLTEAGYSFVGGGNIAHTAHIGGLIAGMATGAIVSKIPIGEERRRSYAALRELATTEPLREIYENIERADNEDVRRAWAEELVKEAKCPVCGGHLRMEGNRVECSCGYSLRLQ